VPIPVVCPSCGAKLIFRDETLGTRTKCPKCGEALTVRSVNDSVPVADDTSPLHPGWRKVAFGYRMLGLALVFLVVEVLGTAATNLGIALLYERNQEINDDTPRKVAVTAVVLSFGLVVAVFSFLGHLAFLKMPSDEDGGKGKTLAIGMLVLSLLPGLNWLVPLLLPVFSAGVGTALGERKLTQDGRYLYTWYGTGCVVPPVLFYGCVFVGVTLGEPLVGVILGGVLAVAAGLGVSYMVWRTLDGFRRGIEAAVRERGLRR
jgi:hypothetical protein